MSDTLCHYGVLGMKWGVRRTPEQLGHPRSQRQTKSAQRKYDKKVRRNWYKAYNKAAEYANSHIIPELNQKWAGKKLTEEYYREYDQAFGEAYTKAFLEMFGERPT